MTTDRRTLFEARDAALKRVDAAKAELAQAQGELVRANMTLNDCPAPGRPYAMPVTPDRALAEGLTWPALDDTDDAFWAEARKAKEAAL